MTRSNNTTRARAHEAKVEKVLSAYKQASGRVLPTWSAPDTVPEDSIDAFVRSQHLATLVTLGAFSVLSLSFGLGLGYLLFHP